MPPPAPRTTRPRATTTPRRNILSLLPPPVDDGPFAAVPLPGSNVVAGGPPSAPRIARSSTAPAVITITGAEETPAAPPIPMIVATEFEEPEAAEKRMLVRRFVGEFKKFDIAPSFKLTVYEVALGPGGGVSSVQGQGGKTLCSLADTLADIIKTCAGWDSVGDEFKVWRADHHFPHAHVKEYLNLDSVIETAEFVKTWLTSEEAYHMLPNMAKIQGHPNAPSILKGYAPSGDVRKHLEDLENSVCCDT